MNSHVHAYTEDAFDSRQVSLRVMNVALKKSKQAWYFVVVRNAYGGALLGMGALFYIILDTGATDLTTSDPGVVKGLAAFVFPTGFSLIILTGAELITGNIMYMTMLLLERKISIWYLLKNWALSWIGNLMGALWFAGIFAFYGAIATVEPYKSGSISIVSKKVLEPNWGQIFIRAMGCNWLVALACWLSTATTSPVGKVISIWIPIWTFVALGFEHTVADMFYLPLGMMNGAPLSVGELIWKGFIPIGLGNIAGGAVFVAGGYWFIDVWQFRGEGKVGELHDGGDLTGIVDGSASGSEASGDLEKGLGRRQGEATRTVSTT